MANNTYIIDVLATGTQTVTITDDGTGRDWLDFNGVYAAPTSIRLEWITVSGMATSASGSYFSSGNIGHRLVVNGVIENVRGSNGNDVIAGNHVANLIYGDQSATGLGRADTISGGAGNDTIYGGAGSDSIGGDNGHDRLLGGTGNDTISGGDGIDTVQGGAGADSLSGGSSVGDTVSYAAATGAVRVALTFGTTTTGFGNDAAGDRIFGFTNIIGSAFADILTDTVSGTVAFGGNDNAFYGGGGADSLRMNGGDDTAYGGSGRDLVYGGGGDDLLFGGDAIDFLYGGLGRDTLVGDDGADRFVFTAAVHSTFAPSNRDTIRDFSRAEGDRIDLRALDATVGGTNNAFRFVGADPFAVAGDLRIQDTGTGFLVLGDQDGDGRAEFALVLLNVASLIAADFIL